MNLLLLRGGHVPVAVRTLDRLEYLTTPEQGSLSDDLTAFQTLMYRRLDETLAEYVEAISA